MGRWFIVRHAETEWNAQGRIQGHTNIGLSPSGINQARLISSRLAGVPIDVAYSSDLQQWLEYGGSPRATIALDRCARAHAWLRGADFVSPDDVRAVAADVLRHRLILSFEAEANGVSSDDAIAELLRSVPVA